MQWVILKFECVFLIIFYFQKVFSDFIEICFFYCSETALDVHGLLSTSKESEAKPSHLYLKNIHSISILLNCRFLNALFFLRIKIVCTISSKAMNFITFMWISSNRDSVSHTLSTLFSVKWKSKMNITESIRLFVEINAVSWRENVNSLQKLLS